MDNTIDRLRKMKKILIRLAGSSLLWGLVATFIFYFGINSGAVKNETLVRYSTGHPVEYLTIAMFFVGLIDLTFKIFATQKERRALRRGALFPPQRREKEPLDRVDEYLNTIAKARDVRGSSVYLTRLGDALNFLKYGGSPDDLDQELRFLSDDAYEQRESEYGMVRTFIWAIPILGFLGTVLGITVALGGLDLTHLEATGEILASGLKVAFDTTALALSLVFVLYFQQFFSRKEDAALALSVSRLVETELKGRFLPSSEFGSTTDELETTRKFLQSVAQTFEEATRAQTALWTETMTKVAQKNADLFSEASNRFGETLDKRLTEGGSSWMQALVDAQRGFVEGTLKPAFESEGKRTERFAALEDKLTEQTLTLRQALQAAVDVASIEERLTRTLEKIAEVGEFEKTLNNLSATVCLLNSKLTSIGSASSLPEVVRMESNFARRASRRNDALAALDTLESSFDNSNGEFESAPQPLIFQDFETGSVEQSPARVEPDDGSESAEDAQTNSQEKPTVKRSRATSAKKRTA